MEIVATVIGGNTTEITRSSWKVQICRTRQVLTSTKGHPVTVPTMVFDGHVWPHFTSPHNDPLVIELKVASTLVRRILIDTGSRHHHTGVSAQAKAYRKRDRSPLRIHPRFQWARSKSRMNDPLPATVWDKTKARNLEVDFIEVDVLMPYNVILRQSTLHQVKAAIASHQLQLQFEVDDDSLGRI